MEPNLKPNALITINWPQRSLVSLLRRNERKVLKKIHPHILYGNNFQSSQPHLGSGMVGLLLATYLQYPARPLLNDSRFILSSPVSLGRVEKNKKQRSGAVTYVHCVYGQTPIQTPIPGRTDQVLSRKFFMWQLTSEDLKRATSAKPNHLAVINLRRIYADKNHLAPSPPTDLKVFPSEILPKSTYQWRASMDASCSQGTEGFSATEGRDSNTTKRPVKYVNV
ncbi:predicted protein [Histoplasma capsulatum var. duboisii H88]|uniref:Predicted protein n=1 Tax=Ajellomyces capsulatus (strain H88) TaxID=544711 RepID=F0UCL0_AJEC8|nr:predicted protein [Histoplasma capsulatum var. duboisii H88]